jgi:hypothetical protein
MEQAAALLGVDLARPPQVALEQRAELGIVQHRPARRRQQVVAPDGDDDLVEVGQPLDRVGEGPLIDCWVFGADAVAYRPIGDGGKVDVHDATPCQSKNNVNDYNQQISDLSTLVNGYLISRYLTKNNRIVY